MYQHGTLEEIGILLREGKQVAHDGSKVQLTRDDVEAMKSAGADAVIGLEEQEDGTWIVTGATIPARLIR